MDDIRAWKSVHSETLIVRSDSVPKHSECLRAYTTANIGSSLTEIRMVYTERGRLGHSN